MKLTKENVYIDLRGKSEDELTELWYLLNSNDEQIKHSELAIFITQYHNKNRFLSYSQNKWQWGSLSGKQEVTIQQLKEILQPMENKESLQQQLEKAKAEVERLEKEIEDSRIKVGDWVRHNNSHVFKVKENMYNLGVINESKEFKKITNQQLIILLEDESKN